MEKELENDLKNLEITELNERAENLVALGAVATAATGAAPLPISDVVLLIPEQVVLMAKICDIYGIDVDKDGLKMLVTTALSTGGATLIGKTIVANFLKFFPGPGTAAGAAISATTAGAVTLAMGKAFIMVCQAVKLGKLSKSDLTSEKGAAFMKEKFREQVNKKIPKDFTEENEMKSKSDNDGTNDLIANYSEVYKTMSIDALYTEGQAYAYGGSHVKDLEKAADYYFLADKKSMEYRGYHHEQAQRSLEILEHNYYIKPLCRAFM